MGRQRLELAGAFNFRDVAGFSMEPGLRMRRGRVFRSDALHRLTPDDVVRLEELGIGRVFDLRSTAELDMDGLGPFASAAGRHVHVPLVEVSLSPFDPLIDWSRIDLQSRYVEMLREGAVSIRAILSELAGPAPQATVVHCTGGKDRTGVVVAVLLRALGVADDEIVADYAISEVYLRALTESYRSELEQSAIGVEAVAYLTSSPPERMRFLLSEMDRIWGSTTGYLEWIGVDRALVERLCVNLLAPEPLEGSF